MNDRSTLLLEHNLKELKLPSFLREYGKIAAQCAAEGVDNPQYLLRLAELELIDRHQRMVERRIRAARFPAVKNLDTFDFPTIPSLNKALVMELARCEYIQRRENVIAVGNSGTGKTHVALGLAACQRGLSVGFTTAAGLVHELMEARDERRLLNLQRQTVPPQPADHRRAGLCPTFQDRRGTALRGLQPALPAGLHPGDHQPALRRVDRGLRLGASHRSPAGPAHPPRPHPGNERRKLPTQAQPGERRLAGFRRTRRRLAHTDAVSSRSQNSAYSTCLPPQVIGQVVHDSSAPVVEGQHKCPARCSA